MLLVLTFVVLDVSLFICKKNYPIKRHSLIYSPIIHNGITACSTISCVCGSRESAEYIPESEGQQHKRLWKGEGMRGPHWGHFKKQRKRNVQQQRFHDGISLRLGLAKTRHSLHCKHLLRKKVVRKIASFIVKGQTTFLFRTFTVRCGLDSPLPPPPLPPLHRRPCRFPQT